MLLKVRQAHDWILTKLEGTERGQRILRVVNYRKFAIAILAIGLATFLCWYEKINSQDYGEIISWVVALYIGGNGVEHLAKRRSITETVTETKVSSKPAEAQEETRTISKPVQEPS